MQLKRLDILSIKFEMNFFGEKKELNCGKTTNALNRLLSI